MKEHNKWVQLSHSSPKYITGIVQEYSIILPVYISSLDLVSHKQKEFVQQLKILLGATQSTKNETSTIRKKHPNLCKNGSMFPSVSCDKSLV